MAAEMFQPLREEDKAAAATTARKQQDDDEWEPISPVPTTAPEPVFVHRNPRLGRSTQQWSYSDSSGGLEGYICRFECGAGSKTFRPYRYGTLNGDKGWHWKGWGVGRPLYRLPNILAAPTAPILVVEGEKTADAAQKLFPRYVVTTPMHGAQSPRLTDWSPVKGHKVWVLGDVDVAGDSFGDRTAPLCREAEAADVCVVLLPEDFPEKWDLADPMPEGWDVRRFENLLALAALGDIEFDEPEAPAAAAAAAGGNGDGSKDATDAGRSENEAGAGGELNPADEQLLSELAALSRIEYDRRREDAHKQLGILLSTLDLEVELRRKAMAPDSVTDRPFLADVELWAVPVEGPELLDELVDLLREYIVLPDGAAEAIALWVLHTHAHDAAQISPTLAVMSPEKRCGKTTLLIILQNLCPRSLPTANITMASLFRVVELYRPTVLIDEADTFLRDNNELRGVLNSGHNRANACVLRTVGDDHEPKQFSTWSPKAFALIGSLKDTLADRSIIIPLRRKLRDEKVTRFRSDRVERLIELQRKAARYVDDNLEAIRERDPDVPLELHDRAADNWRPLLAIADQAGGDWPALARRVATLLTLGEGTDDDSARVMILKDVKAIFEEKLVERIATKSLLEALLELEDRPWSEWRRGRPLKGNSLANLLRPLDIGPKSLRVDGESAKGYEMAQFTDAWNRYLPDQPSTERLHGYNPQKSAENEGVQTVTPDPDVTDGKQPNPAESLTCNRVTDEIPGVGPDTGNDGVWEEDL